MLQTVVATAAGSTSSCGWLTMDRWDAVVKELQTDEMQGHADAKAQLIIVTPQLPHISELPMISKTISSTPVCFVS